MIVIKEYIHDDNLIVRLHNLIKIQPAYLFTNRLYTQIGEPYRATMFHRYFLSTANVNRNVILRCGKQYGDIHVTKGSCKRFYSLGQTRTHLTVALFRQPMKKSAIDFVWFRNYCTKPPAKKSGRSFLTLRRQHQESKREIRRLFSLAKNEKWYLISAIGCLVISTSVTIGVPHAIGKIMDMIVADGYPRQEMLTFCVGLFAVFIAGSLANFGRIYLMNSASKCKVFLSQHNYLV